MNEADGGIEPVGRLVAVEDPEGDRLRAPGGPALGGRRYEACGDAQSAVCRITPQRAEEGLACRGRRLLSGRDDTDRRSRHPVLESQEPEVAAQQLTPPPLVVTGLVTGVGRERVRRRL